MLVKFFTNSNRGYTNKIKEKRQHKERKRQLKGPMGKKEKKKKETGPHSPKHMLMKETWPCQEQ